MREQWRRAMKEERSCEVLRLQSREMRARSVEEQIDAAFREQGDRQWIAAREAAAAAPPEKPKVSPVVVSLVRRLERKARFEKRHPRPPQIEKCKVFRRMQRWGREEQADRRKAPPLLPSID